MPITDPGTPSYVDAGYVDLDYQIYYSTASGAAPNSLPVQGIAFAPPSTPPGWPTIPPTLPVVGTPTGASYWIPGPYETTGETVGYIPPAEVTVDDGIRFPASPHDLILRNSWHGIASTINPANQAAYAALIYTTVMKAVQEGMRTQGGTAHLAGGGELSWSFTAPVSNMPDILNAVYQAMYKALALGTNLWYELVLKPVTNGPFEGSYVVETTDLVVPKTLDLSATSTGE